MFLKELSLTNYKNFESLKFSFDTKIICFVGLNGVGKTNILDSSYSNLAFYDNSALENAELMVQNAQTAYALGEIDYIELTRALDTRYEMQMSYLKAIRQFNHIIHQIRFLLNQ